ncbi:conserved hypothetical protein [Methylocella tundrae]|jgi:hypothetical protein|uniref:Uncharacterized protein n=1 Tax=Methylocella tundrae TaxID=227605 RepID=A0A8B6M488_METTU|nr:DUF6481 family protein [Methylocella tundrae]VTZ28052.1 conserved hypothetical protein [Methylocella tundrae]VTZ48932.1 conserved hypothetical protein [Methylocella tundrae]
MCAFKIDKFGDRLSNAANAKKALLEKFRAKTEVDEETVAKREAARREIIAARDARALERKAAEEERRAREAVEKAERDAALKAEEEARALEAAAEAERAAALEIERKKARDARYAARKARK